MPSYWIKIKEDDKNTIEILKEMGGGLSKGGPWGGRGYQWTIPANNEKEVKNQMDFLDRLNGVEEYFVHDDLGFVRQEFPILKSYGEKNMFNPSIEKFQKFVEDLEKLKQEALESLPPELRDYLKKRKERE